MYKAFLIKYAEIGVKGNNKRVFEDALVNEVKRALKKITGEFKVIRHEGRIYAQCLSEYDYDEVVTALKRVFGIAWICPVVQIPVTDFDAIADAVVEHINSAYEHKDFTFKVESRRARKDFPLNSMEINVELGARILDAFPELKVDVHNPDVLIQVEVRNQVNIYSQSIPGQGGLPLGTAGRAMLLLSGGIDSPVAG